MKYPIHNFVIFIFNHSLCTYLLPQFCSLSAIHLNWYHVMHSVVIIFAQDPQLPPPYTSRFQNFSFTCTRDFCKKKTPKNIFWKIWYVQLSLFLQISSIFYNVRKTLMISYLLTSDVRHKGAKAFPHSFSLNKFMSNFVNVNTALSNFAKRKTSCSGIFFAILL